MDICNWRRLGMVCIDYIYELCFMLRKTVLHMKDRTKKCQRTFGTFASSNPQVDASACKRAKFLPTRKAKMRV